jgi:hypothetical protein
MKLKRVKTYSGYIADEKPLSFTIGDKELKVNKIIDRWRDPDCDYFKILCTDSATYILRHNFEDDSWEITFYNSRP